MSVVNPSQFDYICRDRLTNASPPFNSSVLRCDCVEFKMNDVVINAKCAEKKPHSNKYLFLCSCCPLAQRTLFLTFTEAGRYGWEQSSLYQECPVDTHSVTHRPAQGNLCGGNERGTAYSLFPLRFILLVQGSKLASKPASYPLGHYCPMWWYDYRNPTWLKRNSNLTNRKFKESRISINPDCKMNYEKEKRYTTYLLITKGVAKKNFLNLINLI